MGHGSVWVHECVLHVHVCCVCANVSIDIVVSDLEYGKF